jgi:hypothetical protein
VVKKFFMMMSRRLYSCFSFPFWHLMIKGEWKYHLCTHLHFVSNSNLMLSYHFAWTISFVRTMWCENNLEFVLLYALICLVVKFKVVLRLKWFVMTCCFLCSVQEVRSIQT